MNENTKIFHEVMSGDIEGHDEKFKDLLSLGIEAVQIEQGIKFINLNNWNKIKKYNFVNIKFECQFTNNLLERLDKTFKSILETQFGSNKEDFVNSFPSITKEIDEKNMFHPPITGQGEIHKHSILYELCLCHTNVRASTRDKEKNSRLLYYPIIEKIDDDTTKIIILFVDHYRHLNTNEENKINRNKNKTKEELKVYGKMKPDENNFDFINAGITEYLNEKDDKKSYITNFAIYDSEFEKGG